jgi:hypothetical protein
MRGKNLSNGSLWSHPSKKAMKFVVPFKLERAYSTRNYPYCQEATKYLREKILQRFTRASPPTVQCQEKIIADLRTLRDGVRCVGSILAI